MGQQPLCGATGGAALRRGKIADTWGRKRAFPTGLTIFVAGSVLAGFPTSTATWISARAVQYRQSVLRSSCLPRFPRVNRIPRQIPRNSLWCVGRGNFRCGSGRTLAGGALTEWVSWYSRLSRARPRLVGAPILIQLLWLDLVRKRGYFTGSARAHGFGRGLRAVNQVGKAPRAGSPLGAVVS